MKSVINKIKKSSHLTRIRIYRIILHINLITTVMILFSFQTYSQSLPFKSLTIEDGLSNNDVNTVDQDKAGFIWFGTEDGLNRYDGYSFKVFRHDPNDSTSISDNIIWALTTDSKGNLWIGTMLGIVDKFDPVSEKFTHLKIKSNLAKQNSITALYEDRKGNIWIGTREDGIYKFNSVSGIVGHWNRDTTDSKSLSYNSVKSIIEDKQGYILVGTYKGFNKFDPGFPEKGFHQYYYEPDNPNSLSNNQIYNLSWSVTDSNMIWIGTPDGLTKFNSEKNTFERVKIPNPDNLQFGSGGSTVIEEVINDEKIIWTDTYGGLVRINLNTGDANRFVNIDNNPRSIISNSIKKIFKDRLGVIWIATENGVSYLTKKDKKFNPFFNLKSRHLLNAVRKGENLRAITEDKNGTIWCGFENGLFPVQKKGRLSSNIKYPDLSNNNVWCLEPGDNNSLLIGTFGQGLKKLNLKNGNVQNWTEMHPEINSPGAFFVKSILNDNDGNIWTGFWGLGVARINTSTGVYKLWRINPDDSSSINNNDVWVIKQDRFGRIWLGTLGGGLNLFEDKGAGIFHHLIGTKDKSNVVSTENVFSICEAKNLNNTNDLVTVLWIGTNNGLNKLVVRNNGGNSNLNDIITENHFYTEKDGLPDNSVYSIVEDENGNLWLGTGTGISFFNVYEKKFENFSSSDGIYGSSMNPDAALRLEDGLMLFGSTKGLNVFDPKTINFSSYKPAIVFTDFRIFNKSVEIGDESPLHRNLNNTDEIILSYKQNVFSFEFAALDYNSPQSIRYAYKMEGFDKDWINSGARRLVTYTNLDPGDYIFKVRSTNADGLWNDNIASMKVVITPPWWKTFWAFGLYVVLIILGLIAIRRFELNRTKLRNELKMREFEVKKKSELEELKSRFFANLSHEFRTPLMLIKGPLEQLKNSGNGNYSESIELIERNSNRLKELIDQLLELTQLEAATIPLKAKRENLITILKGLVSSFESLAKQKNINLSFESDSDSKNCWIDRDKLEKIIINLLSNSIKFTPEGGSVAVKVKESLKDENRFAEIEISDSGISIPKDKLDKIFDRFYQVDDTTQRSYGGSGIGLALVKELADLHKWDVSVKSESGVGTNFKLRIPMWDDYLNDSEKVKSEPLQDFTDENLKVEVGKQFIDQLKNNSEQTDLDNSDSKPSILIVDDSEDVRKYLSGLLECEYSIHTAAGGEEGIKLAINVLPDLIVSDVMMPTMDGMEFCSRIKSEWQTSDIPVILLTAKASFDSKLEGLEIGADDYLTKPFDSRELFTRIKNLLEQRERLRRKYGNDFDLPAKMNKVSSADDDFIKSTLKIIYEMIDKPNFSTEQLAKELFVSRTKLHRNIMRITGISPGVFVRTVKLKHAAKLLVDKRLSVTQIAYEIGFSSPAQFTRAFKKQYNCLPSEFLSNYKN